MKNPKSLVSYFDNTVAKLESSDSLPIFLEGADKLISKYNDTNSTIREKLLLGDFHFVPELKQKILSGLEKVNPQNSKRFNSQSDRYLKCTIKIDANASLEELVQRGKYSFVGRSFTSEKFPRPTWESKELDLLIIEFGDLSNPPYEKVVERVTEKYSHLGRFAGIYELAHLGWQYPKVQENFIELYGIGSQEHTRDHFWASREPVWRTPMLTYGYEEAGPKVRGFYSKDSPDMFYNHDFCKTGFVIVGKTT
jgi:hypothetical protein